MEFSFIELNTHDLVIDGKDFTVLFEGIEDVSLRYKIMGNNSNYPNEYIIISQLVSLKTEKVILIARDFSVSKDTLEVDIVRQLVKHYFFSVNDSRNIQNANDKYVNIIDLSKFVLTNDISMNGLRNVEMQTFTDLIIFYLEYMTHNEIHFLGTNPKKDFYCKYDNTFHMRRDLVANFLDEKEVSKEISNQTELELIDFYL